MDGNRQPLGVGVSEAVLVAVAVGVGVGVGLGVGLPPPALQNKPMSIRPPLKLSLRLMPNNNRVVS